MLFSAGGLFCGSVLRETEVFLVYSSPPHPSCIFYLQFAGFKFQGLILGSCRSSKVASYASECTSKPQITLCIANTDGPSWPHLQILLCSHSLCVFAMERVGSGIWGEWRNKRRSEYKIKSFLPTSLQTVRNFEYHSIHMGRIHLRSSYRACFFLMMSQNCLKVFPSPCNLTCK